MNVPGENRGRGNNVAYFLISESEGHMKAKFCRGSSLIHHFFFTLSIFSKKRGNLWVAVFLENILQNPQRAGVTVKFQMLRTSPTICPFLLHVLNCLLFLRSFTVSSQVVFFFSRLYYTFIDRPTLKHDGF